MVDVAFFSSIKLDRARQLAGHIAQFGVQMQVFDITGHRNPMYLLQQISKLPRKTILMTHESLMIPIIFRLARFAGYRYVYIQNGMLWHAWANAPTLQQNVRAALFKSILQNASSVICNSKYLCNELGDYYPPAREKYVNIYNPIDFPEPMPPEEIFAFQDGYQHFVTISNFEYPKKFGGLPCLIHALEKTDVQMPVLHILSKVLTDQGRDNLAAFEEKYKQPSGKVELRFHVNVDVRRFLTPETNFLYCSLPGGDSFPRAILEVLSMGIPSLIVDTNGCAEAVFDSDMALVVPLEEAQIEQGIYQLITSMSDRLKMIQSAPEKIRSQLSWANMAEKYAYILQSCE